MTNIQPPVIYDDYVFWSRAGNILATESLPDHLVENYARTLARKHRVTVAYAMVCDYFIEPERCPNCQDIMPEVGMCWCSSFLEEETQKEAPCST